MNRLTPQRFIIALSILCASAVIVIFASLHFGVIAISSSDIWSILTGQSSTEQGELLTYSLVIKDIRLKRALVAFLVGLALSVSGTVFQALLRNPLADPHILGVSSGGALGAVVATALGIPVGIIGVFSMPAFSFLGALCAISIVYALSKRKGALSLYSLLLVGVILNSFFISTVIFIQTLISSDQLATIFFWLLGNLSLSDDILIRSLYILVLGGSGILIAYSRKINLFSLGEAKAQQLGVSLERTKRICFVVASLITGICVSVSGLIGFVGLVVPHISRLLFGPDHRLLIPASGLLGGIFLVIADTLARTILMPQELPVGVVTSFLGAPFFIYLLKKKEAGRIF